VIIGPHARVWEFSTVRAGSVLCAGVSVGFNCEVTRSFLSERAILGHRIGINRTLVGADAHNSR
jgi:NDP-sugar pyrophosphorylase family protein